MRNRSSYQVYFLFEIRITISRLLGSGIMQCFGVYEDDGGSHWPVTWKREESSGCQVLYCRCQGKGDLNKVNQAKSREAIRQHSRPSSCPGCRSVAVICRLLAKRFRKGEALLASGMQNGKSDDQLAGCRSSIEDAFSFEIIGMFGT